MFPSPSPTPSACGWRRTAGPMTRGRDRGRPPAGPRAGLLLRWMVAGTALTTPARDSKVSWATAYRYPLRGPGGDRRPGPGPSRGPSAAAPVQRTEREPRRDPDPHRQGRPAQPGHGPSPVVFGQGRGLRERRAGGDGSHGVPRVHRSGGARLHPRPDRGRAPRAAGPVPIGLVGDAGPGRQGVPGRGDRRADPREEPRPDTGRGDPQQPTVRHAGPGREGQCHVQALQGPATSLPPGPAAITAIMAAALVIITLWHES